MTDLTPNIPEVVAEVTELFERYEQALIDKNVKVLDATFWNSPHTIRYGTRENERHYGYTEIAEFRMRRGAVNQARVLQHQRITTFGRDFGITNTEYQAATSDKIGRQSQTWVRTENGWKIVSAHVSFGA